MLLIIYVPTYYKVDIFKDKINKTRHVQLKSSMMFIPGFGKACEGYEKPDFNIALLRYLSAGNRPIHIACGFIRDYTKNIKDSSWKITDMNFFLGAKGSY